MITLYIDEQAVSVVSAADVLATLQSYISASHVYRITFRTTSDGMDILVTTQ